jgi:membrane protease YdiL (CAAX protease family)
MEPVDPARTTRLALLFEGGLGLVAIVVGWACGQSPFVGMLPGPGGARDEVVAIGWGLVATGPMLLALVLIDWYPLGPLRNLRDVAGELLDKMFRGASIVQLAVVAAAAGWGEELLFRGLAQAGLSRMIAGPAGPWMGLFFASVLFGVCHWLDTTYAVLAMLAGAYFGLLLLATGSLWTPLVAHAAYDFIALVYLIRPRHLLRSSFES